MKGVYLRSTHALLEYKKNKKKQPSPSQFKLNTPLAPLSRSAVNEKPTAIDSLSITGSWDYGPISKTNLVIVIKSAKTARSARDRMACSLARMPVCQVWCDVACHTEHGLLQVLLIKCGQLHWNYDQPLSFCAVNSARKLALPEACNYQQ